MRENDYTDYGVNVLRSRHRLIRELKRHYKPAIHGFRVWPSSWLLIDYFRRTKIKKGTRLLDIGCGWGLAGIYCAKNHGSIVTCVDSDASVFPYVNLHADINDVVVDTMESDFEKLSGSQMKGSQILIGADICFWREMVESLKKLILRAFESGVRKVVISDPGRPPFEELGEYFVKSGMGQLMDRDILHPQVFQGRILKIEA